MSEPRRECEELREELAEHAAGALGGRARMRVEAHVATCRHCAAELADLRAVLSTVRAVPPEPVPEGLALRASRAAYRAAALRPSVPRVWARIAVPAAAAAVAVVAVALALRGPAPRMLAPGSGPARQVAMGRDVTSPSAEMDTAAGPRAGAPPLLRERAPAAPRRRGGVRGPRLGGVGGGAPAPAAPRSRGAAAHGLASPYAPSNGDGLGSRERETAARDEAGGRAAAQPEAAELRPKSESVRGAGTPARRMGMGMPRHGPGVPAESARACDGMVCSGLGGAAAGAKVTAERQDLARAAAAPPVSAHARLMQKEGRSVVGLRLAAEERAGRVRVRVGPGTESRVVWQGLRPRDVSVVLTAEDIGPGPEAIPIRVESEAGVREYMLFVPTMARLGQSAVATPRVRYENRPLERVLADLSALTGFVLLAEGPLDRKVVGELAPGSPESAIRELAEKADLEVEGEGEVVRTLTHRR